MMVRFLEKLFEDKFLTILIVISFLVRIQLIVSFPYLTISSDGGDGWLFFERMISMAEGNYQGNLQFATGYPFLFSFIWRILTFNGALDITPLQIGSLCLIQHFVGLLTSILLYKTVLLSLKCKKTAFICAILYSLSVTDISWAQRTRPVFLAAFLNIFSFYYFIKWEKNNYSKQIYLIYCGFLIALATLCRNHPLLFLFSFLFLIFLKRYSLKRKIAFSIVLTISFMIPFCTYLYCIQYKSTGMFKMRGMGFGAFLINSISHHNLEPDLVSFNRNAGEYTNKLVAFSNYIRRDLSQIPLSFLSAKTSDNDKVYAHKNVVDRLEASLKDHSKYLLPDLSVDKFEYVYYLGVSGYADLLHGYAFEQIRSSTGSYIKIILYRFFKNFSLHSKPNYHDFRFPENEELKIIKKGLFGFALVEWPLRVQNDMKGKKQSWSFYYGALMFYKWYESTRYDWHLYALVLFLILPSVFKKELYGRFIAKLLFLILIYFIIHSVVSHSDARHNAQIEPFIYILFGLSLKILLNFLNDSLKHLKEKQLSILSR